MPAESDFRPHLTSYELAARWRCRRETVSRRYQALGLRPIRVAKVLLFPRDQVEAVERRLTEEPFFAK
jgi:hypothetical protein